jgi:soluble lytic murein transglycosylase-like protein
MIAHVAAMREGIRPSVFIRQIEQESGFNPRSRSWVGAQGIAQIMPETAKAWGVNPHDPIDSLFVAAREMARNVKTYERQGHDKTTAYKLALAAYNAGAGAVAKYHGVPPYKETQNYVKRIMKG